MAISYIRTDTDQLAGDIKQLKEAVVRVEQSQGELSNEIAQLNRMWKGVANLEFRRQLERDFSYMDEILAELDLFIQEMENAKKDYTRCESEVLETVNAVRI